MDFSQILTIFWCISMLRVTMQHQISILQGNGFFPLSNGISNYSMIFGCIICRWCKINSEHLSQSAFVFSLGFVYNFHLPIKHSNLVNLGLGNEQTKAINCICKNCILIFTKLLEAWEVREGTLGKLVGLRSQTKDRKFSVDLKFPHCIQCYCNLSQWYHHHHNDGYVIENWVVQSTILESRINGRGVQRQGSCLSHLLIRAASCFSRKEIPRASVGHREGTVDEKGEMEEDTVNAIKHTHTHTQGVNGQLEIVSMKSFASHLHLSRWSLLCESKGMCFLPSVHMAFLNLQTTHLLIMTHGNSTWSKLQKVWVFTQEGVQE
jgi:hypothetical protein